MRNLLLRSLSPEAFARLAEQMTPVDLPLRHDLVLSHTASTHVFFLESGLASVVAVSSDDERVEVGHLGFDGMSAGHVLCRVDCTPNRTFMQVAGAGHAVPVALLDEVTEALPADFRLLLAYQHCSALQLAHSALANARYSLHERLARWLLMCHDRLAGDDLPLTHDVLALMLGVRRAGVTNELHVIEGIHVIKATRANIRVLDRARLEDLAGGSYGLPEREYARLIGHPIRRG